MSWHYLQEQGEAFLEATCLIGAPPALLKLTPFAETSCFLDSSTGCCPDSLSGTTSAPLMGDPGEGTSMLSAVGSRVRTLAQPVRGLESTDQSRGYGESLRGSLAKYSLDLPLSKTHHICEVKGHSTEFSATFPTWGIMLDGACWGLATSTPRTQEIGSGYLPTPTTIGNELAPSMRKHACHLRLIDQMPAWRAKYSVPGGGPWIGFREWLMGWPIGWTELKPLATGKFQEWQQWHSVF